MGGIEWRALRRVDQDRFGEARIQAHFAAQWLARVARAYIPARAGDAHTNLRWDDAFGGLTAHALPDGRRLGLRIADLTLLLPHAASGGVSSAFPLDGRSDADARAWLGEKMSAIGLESSALDEPPPYEMPVHAIARGAVYAASKLNEFLGELSTWYSNANAVLGTIRQQIATQNLNAPPVRCWPHHFDLDTLVTIEPGHTMGIGFSPGDVYYEEPYFYVSMYPHPDFMTLPSLPSIGHWHSKDFSAAIAPAHRIIEAKEQENDIRAFLCAATKAAIKALG
jgi:hypothetical protein